MCEEVGNGNGSFADADKPQVREFSEALLKLADRYAPHRRTAACALPLRISRSLGP